MRRAHDDGILTIDGDTVSAHLERTGWINFAAFVRRLNGGVAAANRECMELQQECRRLRERLEKYEPKAAERPHDPRPPAEASD